MTKENLTIDQVRVLLLTHLEKTSEAIAGIQIILAKQEESLAHHIKRTNLLEESVELLREQLQPIEKHVEFVNRACRMFAAIAAMTAAGAGVLTASLKVFELFFHQ